MISLFKRKQAYKIVLEEESKPAESIYSCNLTKLQFKALLIVNTVSLTSAGSTTLTLQSEESTAIVAAVRDSAVKASALFSLVILILFQDNIKNTYQSYIQE